MRIVALEEHVSFPSFAAEQDREKGDGRPAGSGNAAALKNELGDVGPIRLKSMDDSGITLQVLSVPGPGAAALPSLDLGPDYAKRYNDQVALEAAKNPTRFRFFAH